MPFLGQDWRSPGEQWVRTSEGWERLTLWRLKLLENLNENVIARILKLTTAEDLLIQMFGGTRGSQPYVFVSLRLTKEQKMQMSISEALKKLDMTGAAKDTRRFGYVCKLLAFLIKHKLCNLSGAAQKIIFTILEELVTQVSKTHNEVSAVQDLLRETQAALHRGHYDHLGSSSLWTRHEQTLSKMQNTLNSIELKKREDDGKVTLTDLPDDCMREILLRLTDHRDLANTALTESRALSLVQEDRVWRLLCLHHFTKQQWQSVVRKNESLEALGWCKLHLRLERRYGLKDVYAEMLALCKHCNALFWDLHGHPCPLSDLPPLTIPIPPSMCVDLFSV